MQRLRHRLYTVSEALEEVLNESSSDDDEDVSDNSGSEVDAVIDSSNSMSSSDVDNEEEYEDDNLVDTLVEDIHVGANTMLSRNGQEQWSKLPQPANTRQPPHNILREAMGPTKVALNVCGQSPMEAFKLLLTVPIVQRIADCTNNEVSFVNQ